MPAWFPLTTVRAVLAACALASAWLPGARAAPVQIAVTKGPALPAHWFPVAGPGPHPAIVALHGCGGLHAKGGALSARFQDTVARLNGAGYSVLLPDSLGARGGVRSLCGTRYGQRDITVAVRVDDARAALEWVAQQPGVDDQRIGLQGWSHGATTSLHVLAQYQQHPGLQPALAGVAVFYPSCDPLERRRTDLAGVPLLMQLGALDDWTPAAPCEALARRLQTTPGADVTLHVYPGSYHGFDGTAPVRLRTDVPTGVSGRGVHQGGNPVAREQALAALDAFWRRVLARKETP